MADDDLSQLTDDEKTALNGAAQAHHRRRSLSAVAANQPAAGHSGEAGGHQIGAGASTTTPALCSATAHRNAATSTAMRSAMNPDAIIRVGDGRGFVIEHRERRYVITASHCLTRPMMVRRAIDDDNEGAVLPPPMPAMYDKERTYSNLLGPLGGECDICAECLFVDPVADIAVLGQPDSQELSEQADAYDGLVEKVKPLPIGRLPPAPTKRQRFPDGKVRNIPAAGEVSAQLLSLDGEWFRCRVNYPLTSDAALWISDAAEPICGGMSGSPIVSESGAAIGIVCVSNGGGTEGGPNPCLSRHLPGWMLR